MGKGCTICNHEQREAIEKQIELGLSPRAIAPAYGKDFSYRTVYRHMKECMGLDLRTRKPVKEPDASVIEGTGTEEEDNALSVIIEDQDPAPISAKKIVESMDNVEELAQRMFEKALTAGEYGACDMALNKIIASRALVVQMAKIAAFGGDLGEKRRTPADREEEEELPPFLDGWFEEED